MVWPKAAGRLSRADGATRHSSFAKRIAESELKRTCAADTVSRLVTRRASEVRIECSEWSAKFTTSAATHTHFMVEFRIAAYKLYRAFREERIREFPMSTAVVFLLSVAVFVVATVGTHIAAMRESFEDLPPLPRED